MKRILSAAAVLTMLAAVGCSPSLVKPNDPGHSNVTDVTDMSLASGDHAKDAPKGAADSSDTADVKADDGKADADNAADASDSAAADSAVEAAAKVEAPVWAAGDF